MSDKTFHSGEILLINCSLCAQAGGMQPLGQWLSGRRSVAPCVTPARRMHPEYGPDPLGHSPHHGVPRQEKRLPLEQTDKLQLATFNAHFTVSSFRFCADATAWDSVNYRLATLYTLKADW